MQLGILLFVVLCAYVIGRVDGRFRGREDVHRWQADAARELRYMAMVRRHVLKQAIKNVEGKRPEPPAEAPRMHITPIINPPRSRFWVN